jgi:hypothetical protein
MKFRYLLLLVAMIITACGVTDFEMPSWDVQISNISLMNKTFPASDLESEDIIVQNDSLIAKVDGRIEETSPELVKSVSSNTPNLPLLAEQQTSQSLALQALTPETQIRVQQGLIEEAEMVMTFDNLANEFTSVDISFTHLLNQDLTPHELTVHANEIDSNNKYYFDMSGLILGSQDPNADNLIISFDFFPHSSSTSVVNLGTVQMSINDDIYFQSFTGFISDVRALDYTSDVDIDYPSNVEDAIRIEQANIYFWVYNEIGFDLDFQAELVAFKDGAEVDRFTIHEDLDNVDFHVSGADIPGESKLTKISIVNNERANQMLRLMPESIALENPYYEVNNVDESVPGFVDKNHAVACDYEIDIPFTATISSNYQIVPDRVTEVEIDSANQDIIEDSVNSAGVVMEIDNSFNLGGKMDIFIASFELTDEDSSLMNAEIRLLDNVINASENGQTLSIDLAKGEDGKDLDTFLNDKVYMRYRIEFFDSSDPVTVMASDYITIKGSLNMNITIDEDEE